LLTGQPRASEKRTRRKPTIGFHRVNNAARQIWGAPPVMLGAAMCSQPARRWQEISVLLASCNDLIKRNRDFENNKRDGSEFQTREASIGCPIWQHADRYARILGKSITRTNPFWLVNVSVWSALCACATPEMR